LAGLIDLIEPEGIVAKKDKRGQRIAGAQSGNWAISVFIFFNGRIYPDLAGEIGPEIKGQRAAWERDM
jgi:hypothetical protein